MTSVAPNNRLTVYVAGPLSDPNPEQRRRYVEKARAACLALWKLGVVPISTHTMWGDLWGAIDEARVAAACDGLLQQCDAVVLLDDWSSSAGTQREVALAREAGMPIFELEDFLRRRSSERDDSTLGA